jgi:tetratricopeptide (TPR) repeat protein
MAELWMTKFADADANLTESLSGFFNTVGVKSFLYLMSQLTLGQVLEYQGELRRATLDYEHIWRYRTSILGPDNPMAVWARCAMVSTYRKLGRYEEADKAVVEVIDARNRTIGPKSSPTVDALIQRLVVYLDFGKFEEAMELVDFILDGGLVDDWFERAVQVDHVLALLEFFAGNIELAISTLQSLIAQSLEIGVEGRVRSLLWVRLDLAKMLRREDRGDEALILFEDLVTSVDSDSSSSWAEPDSPVDLIIAEKALILVRELKSHDAAVLLAKKGLKWVRQEDFWILNGSPAADTTCMKGP